MDTDARRVANRRTGHPSWRRGVNKIETDFGLWSTGQANEERAAC